MTGRTTSPAYLARMFGVGDQVVTGATGVAQKNKVEIMMVLDPLRLDVRHSTCRSEGQLLEVFLDYYKDT